MLTTHWSESPCAQKVESQKHWWTPQPEMETKPNIWRVWDTSAIKNKYQKPNLALQIQSYFNARCNRHLTIFPFPSANSAPNYLVLWSGWIHFSSITPESDQISLSQLYGPSSWLKFWVQGLAYDPCQFWEFAGDTGFLFPTGFQPGNK